jgi:hypothetical protein
VKQENIMMRFNSSNLGWLAIAATFAISPAMAGDDHDHGPNGHTHDKAPAKEETKDKTSANEAAVEKAHDHNGKRGGKVVESGHHHLEILAKDGTLEVYVNGEDGNPEDVKDAKATAAVLSGGKKEDIILAADPGNFLKGSGTFKAEKGTTIVLTLTMPGHEPEQSRIKLD